MPRDTIVVRMGYFQVRIRTHEFTERERVSLLDVKRLGKYHINPLYKEKFSTASRIMTAPTDEMVERLSPYSPPFPRDLEETRQLIENWRNHIR